MPDPPTAAAVVEALSRLRTDADLAALRKRLPAGEEAFGVRMGSLFDVAKANTDLPIAEVERLLDHPAYEPRMAAFCILDFKSRRKLEAEQRAELYDVYLRRHDRITTWDMVDRSAPRVVGGHLTGRDKRPLHELASADEPLRRRTAITAPLFYTRSGTPDLAVGFAVAATLATDPDPIVHKPVGIFLKHACARDEASVLAFLDEHASAMPRAALRLAVEKLAPDLRSAY